MLTHSHAKDSPEPWLEEKILDWVSLINVEASHIAARNKARTSGLNGSHEEYVPGAWIFAEPAYRAWQDSNEKSIFWLRGESKSILDAIVPYQLTGQWALERLS